MDYQELKKEIAEIAAIAESVPEPFREKCFELLVSRLIAEPASGGGESGPSGQEGSEQKDTDGHSGGQANPGTSGKIPLQAQVRVFLAKTGVTEEHLAAVMMMDGDQVHFIREPSPTSVAAGQVEWALLLALKNGVESNKFEADPEAVRSICQDKGFYDRPNFSSNFKKSKNAAYFKGAMEPQGDAQGLTSEGIEALGAVVKSLAAT